ncbi:hypothetical protein DE146DRAFT_590604, partial [Phaeosphaeria sp. MPI-PUGE-AT-0046c]
LTSAVASADGIWVYWKREDLDSFPEKYVVSIAKDMGVSFTPTSSSRSGGLATDARVGIGVGSVVAFLLAVFLVVYVSLRRRRRTIRNQNSLSNTSQANTAEMEDQDGTLATRKWYLGGRWRSEVEVKNDKQAGELDSRSVRVIGGPPVEMEGS